MTGDIKFHTAFCSHIGINFCVEKNFFSPNRGDYVMSVRIHKTASAGAGLLRQCRNFAGTMQIFRVVCPTKILIHIENKAAAFNADMPNRILPFRIVVRVGRKIEGNALLIQCCPSERHIVFPANKTSGNSPGSFHDGKTSQMPVAPNDSLRSGWL